MVEQVALEAVEDLVDSHSEVMSELMLGFSSGGGRGGGGGTKFTFRFG